MDSTKCRHLVGFVEPCQLQYLSQAWMMKLPPNTVIDRRKITEYMLRRRIEDDKSEFLALAGYTRNNADLLLRDIRQHRSSTVRTLPEEEFSRNAGVLHAREVSDFKM
jgi:hypothetical protein